MKVMINNLFNKKFLRKDQCKQNIFIFKQKILVIQILKIDNW